MIFELRTYITKPGKRDDFIEFLLHKVIPPQQECGMKIIGPMLDVNNPDKFIWMRIYSSMEEYTLQMNTFYTSELWKNEIEPAGSPMIQSIEAVLHAGHPGFINQLPADIS
ncbi:MAG: NIPSNAP family protein [Ignavibacteria bacterium]|nr:NIPSNAP family protein [Ignavibacteria bacterium]